MKFASITDAWIETQSQDDANPDAHSHPSRMRGLKQKLVQLFYLFMKFASITDAWIETIDR